MITRIAAVALVFAALSVCAGVAAADGAAPRLKVGIYDSRGIAIAWARSAAFSAEMNGLHEKLEQARAKGDAEAAAQLEKEGQAMQTRLHLRGFSTAGAGDLLAKVQDEVRAVAAEAGVALIVSRWEMPYKDPSIEVVDLTLPLAMLFESGEDTRKILGALGENEPVPLDALSLDPND